jgi:hypothetical protein
MITSIKEINRVSDCGEDISTDMWEEYASRAEDMLAREYPEARIEIEVDYRACGSSVLDVECDDAEGPADEEYRTICHILESAWEACT